MFTCTYGLLLAMRGHDVVMMKFLLSRSSSLLEPQVGGKDDDDVLCLLGFLVGKSKPTWLHTSSYLRRLLRDIFSKSKIPPFFIHSTTKRVC